MSLLALASAKGSPGVTTLALALGCLWPRPVLVAELDPAGGDLAARLGLEPEPGTSTLAAAARHRLDLETLLAHCQPLTPGLGVLMAPPGAGEAGHVASILAPALVERLGAFDGIDVLVDCGRVTAESAVTELCRRADAAALVSRPDISSLTHAGSALSLLQPCAAGLVLVGTGPYPPTEVAEALEVDVLGVVASDTPGAELVGRAGSSTKAARRSLLLRSVAHLADTLSARLTAGARLGSFEFASDGLAR